MSDSNIPVRVIPPDDRGIIPAVDAFNAAVGTPRPKPASTATKPGEAGHGFFPAMPPADGLNGPNDPAPKRSTKKAG
jgi:hypothetical protein